MGVLRFPLAIAVVIAHAGPVFGQHIADGRFAVQMFYMVSGFYMALVWKERYAKSDRAFRTFYLNRFFRIYPQYAIVLVLSIAVSGYAWVTQDRHPIAVAQHFSLSEISAVWVYGTQASLLGLESLLFLERDPDGGLAHFKLCRRQPAAAALLRFCTSSMELRTRVDVLFASSLSTFKNTGHCVNRYFVSRRVGSCLAS